MTNVTDNATNVIPLDDTREKLEADVWKFCLILSDTGRVVGTEPLNKIRNAAMRWLDRQTAITERHWMEICGANANANVELKRRIDELLQKMQRMETELEAKEQLERDSAYMRLPVDADGVPIRVGDEMEWTNKLNGEKERFVCAGYTTEYSTWTPDSITLMATNDECAEFYCDQCRHVQPDTVESLLEEFHGKLWSDDEEQMALLEEYAERIRKAVEHG